MSTTSTNIEPTVETTLSVIILASARKAFEQLVLKDLAGHFKHMHGKAYRMDRGSIKRFRVFSANPGGKVSAKLAEVTLECKTPQQREYLRKVLEKWIWIYTANQHAQPQAAAKAFKKADRLQSQVDELEENQVILGDRLQRIIDDRDKLLLEIQALRDEKEDLVAQVKKESQLKQAIEKAIANWSGKRGKVIREVLAKF